MVFKPKNIKVKVPTTYKSIYIKEDLVKEIENIRDDNTSFNNVVISMIEECLKK